MAEEAPGEAQGVSEAKPGVARDELVNETKRFEKLSMYPHYITMRIHLH